MNISDIPSSPFGNPMPTQPGSLPPLSRERVSESLNRLGINHGADEDGDALSLWDGYMLRFICTGQQLEVLQVRGLWAAQPPEEMRPALLEWFNEWHGSHRWPTVYTHALDEANFVFSDLAVDLEFGVSDEQLDQFNKCAAGTNQQLFADLLDAFPDATSWVPRQQPDGAPSEEAAADEIQAPGDPR